MVRRGGQESTSEKARGSKVVAIVLTLVLVGLLFSGASLTLNGSVALRSEVAISGAERVSQTQLRVFVDSCESQPHLTTLDETPTAISIGISIWRHFRSGAGDCLDSLTVYLTDPLGQRTVIDAHTGEPVI